MIFCFIHIIQLSATLDHHKKTLKGIQQENNALASSACAAGDMNYTDASKLIRDLFKEYPNYRPNFSTYGTKQKTVGSSTVYQGLVKILQRNGGYDVVLTDAVPQTFVGSTFRSGTAHTTQLYRCTKAIQFCTGNPRYCQFEEGDIGTNVILIAPHGGGLEPKQMATRTSGYFINGKCHFEHKYKKKGLKPDTEKCPVNILRDDYTRKLTITIADRIKHMTGKRPHVIFVNLKRSKLDVNRVIEEGTFNEDEATIAYQDFHNFIVYAKSLIKGRGLLVDLHGQSHNHYLVELGYHIQAKEVNKGILHANDSSIYALARHVKIPFKELFHGNASLGYFLEKEGLGTIPSPVHENRVPGERQYFDGKHITEFYGSEESGLVDGIQVEIPKTYRKKATYRKFARKLARAIINYMELNYVHRGIRTHHDLL